MSLGFSLGRQRQRRVGAVQRHHARRLVLVGGVQQLGFGKLDDFAVLDGVDVVLLALDEDRDPPFPQRDEEVLGGPVISRLVVGQQLVPLWLDHGDGLPAVVFRVGVHAPAALLIVRESQAQALVELDRLLVADGGWKKRVGGGVVDGGRLHLHRVVDHRLR